MSNDAAFFAMEYLSDPVAYVRDEDDDSVGLDPLAVDEVDENDDGDETMSVSAAAAFPAWAAAVVCPASAVADRSRQSLLI